MQKFPLIFSLLLLPAITKAQSVGINTTGAAPNPSAMLDVDATNLGLLIPRVALTATTSALPVASPATSLLVYNTATAGTFPNNVTPGYYYWDGTQWLRLLNGIGAGAAWLTTGNAASATDFIGTTNLADWIVRTNNTERMRILANGNVGIGTTAPRRRLDVNGEIVAVNRLTLAQDIGVTTGTWHLDNAAGRFRIFDQPNINTSGVERLTITSAGNVGIGTATPSSRLHVSNTNSSVWDGITIDNFMPLDGVMANLFINMRNSATGGQWMLFHGDPDGGHGVHPRNFEIWEYPNDGGTCCRDRFRIMSTHNTTWPGAVRIETSGSVSAWGFNNMSDERTKENISAMTYGLKEIMQIQPQFYHYKGMPKRRMGFVAQELQQIVPEVVDMLQSEEEKEEFMSVRYADITSLLVKAMQEQQKIIEELKIENDNLKSQISNLKSEYDNRLKLIEQILGAKVNN